MQYNKYIFPTLRGSCETYQVPCTFADDEHVMAAGIDPNIVHQPDITFEKFIAMKNDLIKEHGDMYVNFKKSGSNGEMYQFCKGEFIAFPVPMRLGGLGGLPSEI